MHLEKLNWNQKRYKQEIQEENMSRKIKNLLIRKGSVSSLCCLKKDSKLPIYGIVPLLLKSQM